MSVKKSSTSRKRSASKSAQEIASHVSALINHPDTPTVIYNALVDAISDIDSAGRILRRITDSPEFITEVISEDLKRKGGAS